MFLLGLVRWLIAARWPPGPRRRLCSSVPLRRTYVDWGKMAPTDLLQGGKPLAWADALQYLKYGVLYVNHTPTADFVTLVPVKSTLAVRDHGIDQFLHVFHAVKGRENDCLRWGDEIEYHLIRFDDGEKSVKVSLKAPGVVEQLEKEDEDPSTRPAILSAWRPEFGSWMVEATPGRPYGDTTDVFLQVEANMAMRRRRIQAAVDSNESPMSVVAFPLMGVGDFTYPSYAPGGPYSQSSFVPDECICPFARFGTLVANIRERRGSKVCVCVPLYRDERTDMSALDTGKPSSAGATSTVCRDSCGDGEPTVTPTSTPTVTTTATTTTNSDAVTSGGGSGGSSLLSPTSEVCSRTCCGVVCVENATGTPIVRIQSAADRVCSSCGPQPGHVYMDCMAFGMGCCCLQVTFQAKNLAESRYLYDQLSVLSPIMMALTAASPVFKGKLVDTDTRWDVIAGSVDCRTPAERGVSGPAPGWTTLPHAENASGLGKKRVYKSRYDSIDCFISDSPLLEDKYNDLPLVHDPEVLARLVANGVDERLARHIAHLWIRDPMVIFKERIELNDTETFEHFENLQSTNWQNVRWKPPPPSHTGDMGWRVELRTMEVQLTDFENAAFTVLAVLISRVILFFNLNLYIPISKVDENMAVARLRNSILTQKFHFRSHVVPLQDKCTLHPDTPTDPDAYELMSCEQILCGTGSHFPGLIPLIYTYLDIIKCDGEARVQVQRYMHLIVQRVRGELPTCAQWMRNLIRKHPKYNRDSVVTQEIAYDVLKYCREISNGKPCSDLLGTHTSPASISESPTSSRLRGSSFADSFKGSECAVLQSLLDKYSVTTSFEDTPAFLNLPSVTDVEG